MINPHKGNSTKLNNNSGLMPKYIVSISRGNKTCNSFNVISSYIVEIYGDKEPYEIF
jgi:hypothetical protein